MSLELTVQPRKTATSTPEPTAPATYEPGRLVEAEAAFRCRLG